MQLAIYYSWAWVTGLIRRKEGKSFPAPPSGFSPTWKIGHANTFSLNGGWPFMSRSRARARALHFPPASVNENSTGAPTDITLIEGPSALGSAFRPNHPSIKSSSCRMEAIDGSVRGSKAHSSPFPALKNILSFSKKASGIRQQHFLECQVDDLAPSRCEWHHNIMGLQAKWQLELFLRGPDRFSRY